MAFKRAAFFRDKQFESSGTGYYLSHKRINVSNNRAHPLTTPLVPVVKLGTEELIIFHTHNFKENLKLQKYNNVESTFFKLLLNQ